MSVRRHLVPAALALAVLTVSLLVAAFQPKTVDGSAVSRPGFRLARPVDCTSLVNSLDVRQRLAQLLVVGVDGANPAATVTLVRDHQIGGIFIGGNATALLKDHALDEVQRVATLPVSVAVDEEGGRVQRIDDLDGTLPSARKLAATKTPQEVRAIAADRGRELRARGVTVDFAPDVDVTDQPDDEVIGDRSFSPDPARVRLYATAFATGLQDGGVVPVLKHFPGHGHASGDSHQGLPHTPSL
ncbi:MAG TPA: glycoside hydrolase family 3 N-terminal domain-containing protein, partial [Amycolatopsis sp.]|nr:glycoside hydrolase family 3 N-terminal domain-containing protein [Amycolatopsis sp.]